MTKREQHRWCKKVAKGGSNYDDCIDAFNEGMYNGPPGAGAPTGALVDPRWSLLFDCCILRGKRGCCDKIGLTGAKLSNPTVKIPSGPADALEDVDFGIRQHGRRGRRIQRKRYRR
jgi:hypothetical protein